MVISLVSLYNSLVYKFIWEKKKREREEKREGGRRGERKGEGGAAGCVLCWVAGAVNMLCYLFQYFIT